MILNFNGKGCIDMIKVYIWGTGIIAEKCLYDLLPDVSVLGFVESVLETEKKFYGKTVVSGKQIADLSYDYIILANSHEEEIVNTFTLDEKKTVYYCLTIDSQNGKVYAYRKNSELLRDKLFKSQDRLRVTEMARNIMPCIAVQQENLNFLFDRKDILISNEIICNDENYSKREMHFLRDLAPKKDNGYFLDIGANVGTTSVYFRKNICSTLKYIAFEPLKINYKYLRLNCILNDCDDIQVENIGLSNTNEVKNMVLFDGAFGSSMVMEGNGTYEKCQFMTLDNYMRKNNIAAEELSYIWVDVQCHELEVLEGALETLKQSEAALYIEFNVSTLKQRGTAEIFIDTLMKIYKRFICYEQYAQGKTNIRDIKELEKLPEEVSNISFCNILCMKF